MEKQIEPTLSASTEGSLAKPASSIFGFNALDSIGASPEKLSFEEGDVIFKSGELTKGLFFLESGSVKLITQRGPTRGRTTSPDFIVKMVGPGEFFGYKSLLAGCSSKLTAIALKSSKASYVPRGHVEAVLSNASPLVKICFQQALKDLENAENNAQLYYLASVTERIAYQLVVLTEKFGVPTVNGISLNLKLTRNELAQLASTINESLSRHLTEFKNEGLIEIRGREIIVKDIAGLKDKSGNFKSQTLA